MCLTQVSSFLPTGSTRERTKGNQKQVECLHWHLDESTLCWDQNKSVFGCSKNDQSEWWKCLLFKKKVIRQVLWNNVNGWSKSRDQIRIRWARIWAFWMCWRILLSPIILVNRYSASAVANEFRLSFHRRSNMSTFSSRRANVEFLRNSSTSPSDSFNRISKRSISTVGKNSTRICW